ncbi:multicopper oxidase family protein [Paractinoplanes ferrugineus]|uniref:FtsP/CotA-like multicopper oxidase with cupredoxin domain n=1 Tax=Paractinoplanes ferrugineus TaxID=113564 RepID=A0A919IZP8_9ACTN|nr:multicopper oxidase family protein [Actinoplanes ferrugineus]GIE11390.1 hypothetical protein Afe05nite_32300 [Actinoplanes ferrugineus]
MSTGPLLVTDLLVAVVAAAGWLGAGGAAAAGSRRVALGVAAGALVATLTRLVTVVALARAGWWFAAEKVLIAEPLSLAGTVGAGAWLSRPARETGAVDAGAWRIRLPREIGGAAVGFLLAGYASTAGLLVTVLHGYPASAGTGLLAIAAVAAATAVTWRLLGPRPAPVVSRAVLAVAAAALVAGVGLSAAPGAAAGVHDHRGYPAALAVGEPTRRFTLTAGVRGAAWAFNGQVPGPELAVTVGDVVEVTLRNRDIEQGVTLHWHGYDVPNAQDGVPGVTQDAVRPGQEFVYRFRADQPGTYWYHTHEASSLGVRKGLFGVFVVRPAAVTGVDRVVGGPFVERVRPGTPVRLRLVNTGNTTHRYAPAGAPFRVAAIDGVDLRGPTDLTDTAVAIPAGGRYDLTLTAPATPITLFVDGKATYSTVAATATATAASAAPIAAASTRTWPVLDPLTYGSAAPAPWPRADREFTLVLDRGIDLRRLVPRYAHTVGGAAYPHIPNQTVRRGETVEFTVVNRALVVHPWHLHGFHVLVLSRNGVRATGSPLWLDSFDVRPGEVWEVTFRADNPGVWANHCHNLPHADAGMMLHLTVGG